MTKVKTLLAWGGIFCVIALALLGCSRGFYFDDSRIPSSEFPKVLLVDPAGGLKDAPVNAKICILFSDPMNLKTVAKSLHIRYANITPAVKESAWSSFDDGRLYIYDDEDLILPANTEITVTVDTSAADLDGYHIAKDVVWRFTTSLNSEVDASPPSVNASTLVPTNDEVVNLDSSVSVEFTEGMLRGTVERSFLLQSNDGNNPDSRDHRNGRFTWNGKKVVYIPNEPLGMNDAQYRVSLNNNGIPCRDIAGNSFPDGPPVLSFYTISENVIYVSPSGSDTHEGTNKSRPKATISGAVQEAQEARARGDEFNVVKVAVGYYQDAVDLIDDIAVYGGYQPGFGSEVRTGGSRVFSPSSSAQAIRISGVNGCTIDKLEIHGPPDGQQKAHAVSIGVNSSDVTIQNCTIVGTDGAAIQESVGVSIDTSSDIRLRVNSISGGRGTISSTGVSAAGNCSGITVTENLIEGGGNPLSNSSTGIDLINADAQVSRNVSIRGGNAARNVGVSISGNLNRPVIEQNDLIQGGDAGEVIGIEVKGGAVPVIRDNKQITGGGTSSANAHGILVNEQASPNIYRNIIIGGHITGGSGKAFGVQYDNSSLPPFYCNLFNNFILGGSQESVPSASCHGVYIRNTNLLIVNNTIDGGGHYDGADVAFANTYGIYATVDPPDTWTITPRIINNYIIGGNSNSSFGVRLYSNGITPFSGELFNNIFNFSVLVTNASYLGIGTTGVSSIGDIDQLNESVGASYITPAPENNLRDPYSLNTTFLGWAAADYHIDNLYFTTVANKGYSGIPAAIPPETLQEVLIDIDSQRRHIQNPDGTSNYALVDLGADEVQ